MNSDPGPLQSGAIAASLNWLQLALIGNLATTVAIFAVASFGLMLMFGHVSRRRGIQLVLACFILFGAPSIAAGIMHVLSLGEGYQEPASLPPVASAPVTSPPAAATGTYDPYAGAALPPRR